MTSVSDLCVVPPTVDGEVKCLSSDSESEVSGCLSPAVLVRAGKSSVRSRKRVTFAVSESTSESESPSARDRVRKRRGSAPRRSGVCFGGLKGNVSPSKKTHSNSDHVWYSSRLAHKPIDFSFVFFVSRRVRLNGSVDDVPVNNITADTCYRRTCRVSRLIAVSPHPASCSSFFPGVADHRGVDLDSGAVERKSRINPRANTMSFPPAPWAPRAPHALSLPTQLPSTGWMGGYETCLLPNASFCGN